MGVYIFWDSRVPLGFANPVTEGLSNILNIPVSRIDNGTFPLEGYNSSRHQYNAVAILKKLDIFRSVHPDLFKHSEDNSKIMTKKSPAYEKVLLITSGDLYTVRTSSVVDNFVFGLAHIKLGVAVVSITRLMNEYYGRHPDDSQLIKRIITESSHEIAHLYGLEHCRNPRCIMYCPNTFDDLDCKDVFFCGKCRLELDSRIQGGV